MSEFDSNSCNEPSSAQPDLNIDPSPDYCAEGQKPSQKSVAGADLSWLEDEMSNKKTGHGQSVDCDPMQTGHIIQEQGMNPPNRNTLYRYSKTLRGADEAMHDMFRDIVVIDEEGKAHSVPIIWASQEKAVGWILQDNIRQDNSTVVDRIRLPMMAIYATDYNYNQDRYIYHKAIDYLRDFQLGSKPGFTTQEKYGRDTIFGVTRGIPVDIGYTLYVWTMSEEDAKQIVEQISTKMFPMAYIRVRGVSWEIPVRLESVSNNTNMEPGDQATPVRKYEFKMTAESFVSQPIVRKKAVLKTQVEVTDSLDDENINEVISRLETAIKELKE